MMQRGHQGDGGVEGVRGKVRVLMAEVHRKLASHAGDRLEAGQGGEAVAEAAPAGVGPLGLDGRQSDYYDARVQLASLLVTDAPLVELVSVQIADDGVGDGDEFAQYLASASGREVKRHRELAGVDVLEVAAGIGVRVGVA